MVFEQPLPAYESLSNRVGARAAESNVLKILAFHLLELFAFLAPWRYNFPL
jgi:hypothetical protein